MNALAKCIIIPIHTYNTYVPGVSAIVLYTTVDTTGSVHLDIKKKFYVCSAIRLRNLDNYLSRKNKLEVFEMWCFSKTLDYESYNKKKVLYRIKKNRQLRKNILARR